eukprot:3934169-Rhodomonas_salina.1
MNAMGRGPTEGSGSISMWLCTAGGRRVGLGHVHGGGAVWALGAAAVMPRSGRRMRGWGGV